MSYTGDAALAEWQRERATAQAMPPVEREKAARRAFDRDAYRAWQALEEYLDCHDQHPDSAKSAREDMVSAIIDMLTNDEIAEAAAWAKVRAAGRIAA